MTRGAYLKHKDLIEAWANGAEVEAKTKYGEWLLLVPNPSWSEDVEYRIKPKQTIAEWLEENNSDYVPDWNDWSKAKYTIYYSTNYKRWKWFMTYGERVYGAIYMSEDTAHKLTDLLNKGEVIEG